MFAIHSFRIITYAFAEQFIFAKSVLLQSSLNNIRQQKHGLQSRLDCNFFQTILFKIDWAKFDEVPMDVAPVVDSSPWDTGSSSGNSSIGWANFSAFPEQKDDTSLDNHRLSYIDLLLE